MGIEKKKKSIEQGPFRKYSGMVEMCQDLTRGMILMDRWEGGEWMKKED